MARKNQSVLWALSASVGPSGFRIALGRENEARRREFRRRGWANAPAVRLPMGYSPTNPAALIRAGCLRNRQRKHRADQWTMWPMKAHVATEVLGPAS